MSRAILLATVSTAALFSAMPGYRDDGWYGAVDAGWHYGLYEWDGSL